MAMPRRAFALPEPDREFLDARGLPWETIVEGGTRWVLIHGYPVHAGYNHAQVSLGLEILPSYPDTQIDMVYFHPYLVRMDRRAIAQVTERVIDGRRWQRWSRHRTGANPWRRGCDCIETHLLLVDEWLERELRKAA